MRLKDLQMPSPWAGHELTEHEKEVAGMALYYGMGITLGALYGAAAEIVPGVKVGAAVPFARLSGLLPTRVSYLRLDFKRKEFGGVSVLNEFSERPHVLSPCGR